MRWRRILVFCAHSDDQAFGAGGFLADASRHGCTVRTVIASFGEQSHPHLAEREIKRMRVLESKKADKILGGDGVMFLGLHEGKFEQEFERRALRQSMRRTIEEFKPDLILTHSPDDPHPDHRACFRIMRGLPSHAELYVFDIWTPVNLRKRLWPKLVIDVTGTFHRKLEAIGVFRSQRHATLLLLWSVYAKAIFWGLRSGSRYAEVLYKVR